MQGLQTMESASVFLVHLLLCTQVATGTPPGNQLWCLQLAAAQADDIVLLRRSAQGHCLGFEGSPPIMLVDSGRKHPDRSMEVSLPSWVWCPYTSLHVPTPLAFTVEDPWSTCPWVKPLQPWEWLSCWPQYLPVNQSETLYSAIFSISTENTWEDQEKMTHNPVFPNQISYSN